MAGALPASGPKSNLSHRCCTHTRAANPPWVPRLCPDASAQLADNEEVNISSEASASLSQCSLIGLTFVPTPGATSTSSTSSSSSSEELVALPYLYLAQGCVRATSCSGTVAWELVDNEVASPPTAPMPPAPTAAVFSALAPYSTSNTSSAKNSPLAPLPPDIGLAGGDSLRRDPPCGSLQEQRRTTSPAAAGAPLIHSNVDSSPHLTCRPV